jgi:parvulin-like peptidyl-prolyl isomerase
VRIQKLIEHRNDEAPVASRAQARSYYETHLEEFTEPKRYELVYVMFPTPEDSDQLQVEEVRTRAQRFADAARSDGADFESLADEATVHGARTIDSPVENLSVVLAKAVEKATPGEVVGPLESDYGYYVMRLDEVHPASTVPFEQVDDQLVGRLSREKYEVSLGELRNELRASSEIVMLWGNVRVEVAE